MKTVKIDSRTNLTPFEQGMIDYIRQLNAGPISFILGKVSGRWPEDNTPEGEEFELGFKQVKILLEEYDNGVVPGPVYDDFMKRYEVIVGRKS